MSESGETADMENMQEYQKGSPTWARKIVERQECPRCGQLPQEYSCEPSDDVSRRDRLQIVTVEARGQLVSLRIPIHDVDIVANELKNLIQYVNKLSLEDRKNHQLVVSMVETKEGRQEGSRTSEKLLI